MSKRVPPVSAPTPEVSLTIAEMVVPVGVTGVGFAVRLWMIGPPEMLPELLLVLVAPPPPLLPLELAPPLPEAPPVPAFPPVPDVVPLELELALGWQNPRELSAERAPWQVASLFDLIEAVHVAPSLAGKPGTAQQTESAAQLGAEELAELAELPLPPHATTNASAMSAAPAHRLGTSREGVIFIVISCA